MWVCSITCLLLFQLEIAGDGVGKCGMSLQLDQKLRRYVTDECENDESSEYEVYLVNSSVFQNPPYKTPLHECTLQIPSVLQRTDYDEGLVS